MRRDRLETHRPDEPVSDRSQRARTAVWLDRPSADRANTVRHYEAVERHLAADALQRVNDLEAALEPLGLAADASAEVSRRPLPDRGLGAGQGGPGGPAPHLAGCRSNKGSAPRTARRRAGRHGQSHPEWAVCARPRGSGGVSLAPPTRPFGDTAVRAARSVARTGGPPAGADRRLCALAHRKR